MDRGAAAAEVADFDVAWGMVEVNLVASLTLRDPIRAAIFLRRREELKKMSE
jgi:hypothetical protein